MAQQNRVGTTATTVSRDGGTLRVTYHATTVVEQSPDGTITLHSGGWQSNTTKTRMNQASNEYGLGFQVYAKDRRWFVDYNGRTLPFVDGMTL